LRTKVVYTYLVNTFILSAYILLYSLKQFWSNYTRRFIRFLESWLEKKTVENFVLLLLNNMLPSHTNMVTVITSEVETVLAFCNIVSLNYVCF
jgi:hypothetical protein